MPRYEVWGVAEWLLSIDAEEELRAVNLASQKIRESLTGLDPYVSVKGSELVADRIARERKVRQDNIAHLEQSIRSNEAELARLRAEEEEHPMRRVSAHIKEG